MDCLFIGMKSNKDWNMPYVRVKDDRAGMEVRADWMK